MSNHVLLSVLISFNLQHALAHVNEASRTLDNDPSSKKHKQYLRVVGQIIETCEVFNEFVCAAVFALKLGQSDEEHKACKKECSHANTASVVKDHCPVHLFGAVVEWLFLAEATNGSFSPSSVAMVDSILRSEA